MTDTEPDEGATGITKYKAGCQDCPKELGLADVLPASYTEHDSADLRDIWIADHAKRDDERVVPEHAPFIAGQYTLPAEETA